MTQINHKRNRIKILPEYIINKISAGEIVNRPASVVKELIENSIDAESTRIVVDIKDGGKKLIWVSDNGCGMDKDDVKLAFERHATSKITCMEDLDRIESLGFRGEALPSIAAVSRVEVVTCTEGAISGTLLKIEGGVIKEIKDTGAPQGTSIKVKDLFFNTPVRRKFLRAITTETGHINFIVSRIAMSYPHISFKLLHNGVEVINVEATKDLYERLSCFLGDEMKDKVIPVKFIVSSVKIYGVILPPSHTRPNRDMQSVFVNHRYITSKTITHAISTGYHTLIPKDRYPVAIIFIDIPPEDVDVNIHPAKSEVRFRHENEIYNLVVKAIREALMKANLIVDINIKDTEVSSYLKNREVRVKEAMKEYFSVKDHQERYILNKQKIPERLQITSIHRHKFSPADKIFQTTDNVSDTLIIHPVCQIHNTYIIGYDSEGLCIVDQHAAHERIIYENLMEQARNNRITSQVMLLPSILELDYKESADMLTIIPVLTQLGFKIEEFGKNTFIIQAIPTVINKCDPKEIILDIIYEFQNTGKNKKTQIELREAMLIALSCKSAIKAGKQLTQEEVSALISQLISTKQPYTCPHGRPTIIRLSLDELEKKFMRK